MAYTGSLGSGGSEFGLITLGMVTDDPSTASSAFGQAQAKISTTDQFAQSQAQLIAFGVNRFAQSQADIKAIGRGFAQAKADLNARRFAQAQADIDAVTNQFAQAQSFLNRRFAWAQAQAKLNTYDTGRFGQARTIIIPISGILGVYGLAAGSTNGTGSLSFSGTYTEKAASEPNYDSNLGQQPSGFPRASDVNVHYHKWFYADQTGSWTFISRTDDGSIFTIYNESMGVVGTMNNNYGGGQGATTRSGTISLTAGTYYKLDFQWGQGGGGYFLQAWYRRPSDVSDIFLTNGSAPWMASRFSVFGQAAAFIRGGLGFAQAQAYTLITGNGLGQAQADIKTQYSKTGQANAFISTFPVIWYKFNESSGTLVDSADSLNLDTVVGSPTYQVGGYRYDSTAIQFNHDGYLSGAATTSLPIGSSARTVEFWMQSVSLLFGQTVISWGSAAANSQFTISLNSTTSTQIGFNGSYYDLSYNDAQWHHFAFSYEDSSTEVKFYFDGTYLTSFTLSNPLTTSSSNLYLGSDISATNYLDTRLDEVKIYNYVLTPNQIRTNYGTKFIGFAQAMAFIGPVQIANAQALIFHPYGTGQTQAKLNAFGVNAFAQAQTYIQTHPVSAQAQAKINAFGYPRCGQAKADILATTNKFGQAKAYISVRYYVSAQAQAYIIHLGIGQAQAKINAFGVNVFGQAQAQIFRPTFTYQGYAQAEARIRPRNREPAQAQADIRIFGNNVFGQARGYIGVRYGTGQAKASIIAVRTKSGQARAFIGTQVFAQAQALLNVHFGFGLAQAQIILLVRKYAQAQARIIGFDIPRFGQALATLAVRWYQPGQTMADIAKLYWVWGQARAYIGFTLVYGNAIAQISPYLSVPALAQAKAKIVGYYLGHGNSRAYIDKPFRHGNAQGYIHREGAGGLVRYGNYVLPGFFNEEELLSVLRINMIEVPFMDGPVTDIDGRQNKFIRIKMIVLENTYAEIKRQITLASTMLRSSRDEFIKLTLIDPDKYYLVKTQSISFTQNAQAKWGEYQVTFECKPWRYGKNHTISDPIQIDTDAIGRTYLDGTWTPAKVTVTGTDVTVSGYTATGDFAGFISVSGTVSNFVIDTNNYYSNQNELLNPDYSLNAGPGQTIFDINGAIECTVEFTDRWEL